MPKRTNINTFLENAKIVHGDLYDYSQIEYKSAKTPIKIICKKHGEFYQIPQVHLTGCGCPKCMADDRTMSQEEFIKRAKEKFGDKYDYSLVVYKGNKKNVKIICPVHGIFEQRPDVHLQKNPFRIGCPKCANEMPNKQMFIQQAIKIHGEKYDYSGVEYVNAKTKVKIICREHGEFYQTPDSHLCQKTGCPVCRESKGERYLSLYFERHGIKYIRQYPLIDKEDDNRFLRADFYLPEKNIVVEYHGLQHYRPVEALGGEEKFYYSQKNDNRKRNFCKAHKIRLIEIKYNENIDARLSMEKLA